jgi:hypothetical protein
VDEESRPGGEAAPMTCPPHHWLVEADPEQGDQHWVCQRCGAEQVHAAPSRESQSFWHRSRPGDRTPPRPDAPT